MKPETRKASLRCAAYTQVSTEHGLEQEFNSLDNQREASEAVAGHFGGVCLTFVLSRQVKWQHPGA